MPSKRHILDKAGTCIKQSNFTNSQTCLFWSYRFGVIDMIILYPEFYLFFLDWLLGIIIVDAKLITLIRRPVNEHSEVIIKFVWPSFRIISLCIFKIFQRGVRDIFHLWYLMVPFIVIMADYSKRIIYCISYWKWCVHH
jgi:hypothetical protein